MFFGRVAGSRDGQYLVLGHPGIVTFTVSARETEFVFSAGKKPWFDCLVWHSCANSRATNEIK